MIFDTEAMEPRDAYKLAIALVVPRPIALVTTRAEDGTLNAAPFSFFNLLGYDPLIVALGIEPRPEHGHKDTATNIRGSEEFTVNLVSREIAEKMNLCAIDFPPDVDEISTAGFTTAPCHKVKAPRIAESPVALECKKFVTLEVSKGRHLAIGRVVQIHVRDDVMADPERLYVDSAALDTIGRLGGPTYSTIRDRFDLPRVTLEEWEAGTHAAE